MNTRPAMVGDRVDVVSGPHEGRGGRVVHIGEPKITGYGTEPEPYAIVEFQERDQDTGQVRTDQIACPVRRLQVR